MPQIPGRIVHLLSADERCEGELLAYRAAAGGVAAREDALLVGDSQGERFVQALGVNIADRVQPQRANPARTAAAVRSVLDGWSRGEPIDAVVCWGAPAAALDLGWNGPARVACLASPSAAAGDAEVIHLSPNSAGRGAWSAPLGPGPVDAGRRASIRRDLDVDEDALVVGLLPGEACEPDVKRWSYMLGLLLCARVRVIGIAPAGRVSGARRAARFVRAHGRRWGLVLADGPVSGWIGACDTATAAEAVPPEEGAGQPCDGATWGMLLAWGMGVPVVAPPQAFEVDAPQGVREACAVRRPTAPGGASPLLELLEDGALRERIGVDMLAWARRTAAQSPPADALRRSVASAAGLRRESACV